MDMFIAFDCSRGFTGRPILNQHILCLHWQPIIPSRRIPDLNGDPQRTGARQAEERQYGIQLGLGAFEKHMRESNASQA